MNSDLWKKVLASFVLVGSIQASAGGQYIEIDYGPALNAIGLSREKKAELIAQQADVFMSPLGFPVALEIVDKALALDANNLRARLYRAILLPMVELRGFIYDVLPLRLKVRAEVRRDLDRLLAMPKSELKSFLTGDVVPSIRNEAQLQAIADRVIRAFDAQRRELRDIKDANIRIHAQVVRISGDSLQAAYDCPIERTGQTSVRMKVCSQMARSQISLDRSDLEMMQQISAYQQLAYSATNAYRLDGALDLDKEHLSSGRAWTEKEVYARLHKIKDFGVLRDNNGLGVISAIGSDLVGAVLWSARNERDICARGQGIGRADRSTNLFTNGICVGHELAKDGKTVDGVVANLITSLKGGAVMTYIPDRRRSSVPIDPRFPGSDAKNARVAFAAPFLKPIGNLRQIAPVNFGCRARTLKDGTVGGLFPDGDGNEVLRRLDYLDTWCNLTN